MFELFNIKYKNILQIEYLKIENEITCIVGESGGGKTTTMKLLNNMITCDSGKVLYNGTNVLDIDPIRLRRNVVMLQQTPIIFTGTIEDNLSIGLKLTNGIAPTKAEIEAALKLVLLDKPLTENAEVLSGGEKQRVALARVLLMSPKVVLLDEPTSALDENTSNKVVENLVGFCKANDISIVMVTHSKEIANRFGDRIIEISCGKVKS